MAIIKPSCILPSKTLIHENSFRSYLDKLHTGRRNQPALPLDFLNRQNKLLNQIKQIILEKISNDIFGQLKQDL